MNTKEQEVTRLRRELAWYFRNLADALENNDIEEVMSYMTDIGEPGRPNIILEAQGLKYNDYTGSEAFDTIGDVLYYICGEGC